MTKRNSLYIFLWNWLLSTYHDWFDSLSPTFSMKFWAAIFCLIRIPQRDNPKYYKVSQEVQHQYKERVRKLYLAPVWFGCRKWRSVFVQIKSTKICTMLIYLQVNWQWWLETDFTRSRWRTNLNVQKAFVELPSGVLLGFCTVFRSKKWVGYSCQGKRTFGVLSE